MPAFPQKLRVSPAQWKTVLQPGLSVHLQILCVVFNNPALQLRDVALRLLLLTSCCSLSIDLVTSSFTPYCWFIFSFIAVFSSPFIWWKTHNQISMFLTWNKHQHYQCTYLVIWGKKYLEFHWSQDTLYIKPENTLLSFNHNRQDNIKYTGSGYPVPLAKDLW